MTKRDLWGAACAGWLGAALYAAFTVPGEFAALRSGIENLSGQGGIAGALMYGRAPLEHGLHIFLSLGVVAAGALVLLYQLAELLAENPGRAFEEFVKDCFVRGDSILPLLAARAVLPRDEIERRRMLAEQFLCMACGVFRVEREGGGSRFLTVEDAGARDQGRIRVHEAVLRRMGRELMAVLPQEARAASFAYGVEQRDTALRILAETFGLSPAPMSLGVTVETRQGAALWGASVETS